MFLQWLPLDIPTAHENMLINFINGLVAAQDKPGEMCVELQAGSHRSVAAIYGCGLRILQWLIALASRWIRLLNNTHM